MERKRQETCSHPNAASLTSRLAMLLSADGLACFACRSRLRVPKRVRLGLLELLLAAMALLPFSAVAATFFSAVLALVGLPWLRAVELEVTPLPE